MQSYNIIKKIKETHSRRTSSRCHRIHGRTCRCRRARRTRRGQRSRWDTRARRTPHPSIPQRTRIPCAGSARARSMSAGSGPHRTPSRRSPHRSGRRQRGRRRAPSSATDSPLRNINGKEEQRGGQRETVCARARKAKRLEQRRRRALRSLPLLGDEFIEQTEPRQHRCSGGCIFSLPLL